MDTFRARIYRPDITNVYAMVNLGFTAERNLESFDGGKLSGWWNIPIKAPNYGAAIEIALALVKEI